MKKRRKFQQQPISFVFVFPVLDSRSLFRGKSKTRRKFQFCHFRIKSRSWFEKKSSSSTTAAKILKFLFSGGERFSNFGANFFPAPGRFHSGKARRHSDDTKLSPLQQKRCFFVSAAFFIVRLDRPFLSASVGGLTMAGGRSSGSGTTRLTGLESSWRCRSWIRTRPGTKGRSRWANIL